MEALSETLRIRVTKADKAKFEAYAEKRGLNLSAFARSLLLTVVAIPDPPVIQLTAEEAIALGFSKPARRRK